MIPLGVLPSSNGDINGIVRKTGEIPIVSSTELNAGSSPIKAAFDNSDAYSICTIKQENSYMEFSFPKRYIMLSNYTITVNSRWSEDSNFPVKWKVEGRTKKGKVLVSNVENSQLKQLKARTFPSLTYSPLKSIRITLLGQSHGNAYHFCIHKLDFFGDRKSVV